MAGVSLDQFKEYVSYLVANNILKKDKIFGYQKKALSDVLDDMKLLDWTGNVSYITSILDGKRYCYTNGKFKTHLKRNNISDIEYLEKCGFIAPVGYRFVLKFHGKDSKKIFLKMKNGEQLYFYFRSVMTSVTYDPQKMIYFYGISEKEANNIAYGRISDCSERSIGEKNNSFGKKGLLANCYKPFIEMDDPKKGFSDYLVAKNRIYILKWAAENDIDETDYEKIKFLYYSMVFRNLNIKKGQEYKEIFNLETVEQGVYLYNKEKAIKNYDPKNFLEYNKKIIELHGNDEDKILFKRYLETQDYHSIMSLSYSLRNMQGFGKRVYYISDRFGKFSLRSKLEKGFVYFLDRIDFVKYFKYENIRFPYLFNGSEHMYYVDFEVGLNNGKKLLLEVKPYNQAIIPDGKVKLKKDAAIEYASKNGFVYEFITEKDMKYELIKKKLQSL